MNLKQQTFVTEYLRHRSVYTAYCLAYNPKDAGNYDSIMSAANRLLHHPEVGAAVDSILKGIRHEVEQEIRAELKTELLTLQRKREILAKIATGEMYAVQVHKGKDCTQCSQHVWPTINQMLKAIDLDNRMVGLYTPHLSAGNKQHSTPSINAQVAEQVDKFLKSMGLVTQQAEDPVESQQTTTIECPPLAGVSEGRGWSTREGEEIPEKPTKDNNTFATDNVSKDNISSFEGGAEGGGCPPAQENAPQPKQSTTFVSPGGLINIRTNRDSDAQGGDNT